MNKEQVYEEKLRPLVRQITDICVEHDIAMLVTFATPIPGSEHVTYTTSTTDENGQRPAHIQALVDFLIENAESGTGEVKYADH